MRIKRSRALLPWVFILSMLFYFFCEGFEKKKSEIQSTFSRYKSALLSANGKAAAEEVCSQTILWYEKARNDGLSMKLPQLNRADILRKFTILRLRHEFSKKQLENMDGKQLFIIGVNNGWISADMVRTIQLDRIEAAADQAKAYIKKSPLTPAFHFIKENKKWKLALVKSFPLVIKTLKAIKPSGVNEDEWIITLLETVTKKKVDKKIFDGYPSSPSTSSKAKQISDAVSMTSKVNLNKIGVKDQVIYTLTISGIKDLSQPELQGLDDFQMVNTSKGSSYEFSNGKGVLSEYFDYYLKPLRTGTLKIPRQVFNWQGKKYTAGKQAVEVVPGSLKAASEALRKRNTLFEPGDLLPGSSDITVKSKININKIGIRDQVIYTLTTTGLDNPSQPVLSGLGNFKVTRTSTSSKIIFVEGKSSRSVSFIYFLKPMKTGNLKIPAHVLNWGGKKYIAREQVVEVVSGSLKAARDALLKEQEKKNSFFDQ
jgi:hypothetical protein